MNHSTIHRLLTISQFCELANISPSRFYLERSAGRIQVLYLGIRSVRIRISEYEAWLKRLKPLHPTTPTSGKGEVK